jgi:hypothetical protein
MNWKNVGLFTSGIVISATISSVFAGIGNAQSVRLLNPSLVPT